MLKTTEGTPVNPPLLVGKGDFGLAKSGKSKVDSISPPKPIDISEILPQHSPRLTQALKISGYPEGSQGGLTQEQVSQIKQSLKKNQSFLEGLKFIFGQDELSQNIKETHAFLELTRLGRKVLPPKNPIFTKAALEAGEQQGHTALIGATRDGNFPVAQLLIKAMTAKQLAQTNRYGNTALSLGASRNRVDICKILLSKMNPKYIQIANKLGHTALYYAHKRENHSIIELITKHAKRSDELDCFAK